MYVKQVYRKPFISFQEAGWSLGKLLQSNINVLSEKMETLYPVTSKYGLEIIYCFHVNV